MPLVSRSQVISQVQDTCPAWLFAATTALVAIFAATAAGQQPKGALYSTRDDAELTAADLASRVALDDALFLGEEHDNDAGHAWQLAIIRALHQEGVPLVVSMEMFERDVQGAVDDYLAGRIDEETFRASARPWPNYEMHYRPIVEFAKRSKIPVIAANVPRQLASQLARGESLEGTPQRWRPREWSAPSDAYWRLFLDAMKGHAGAEASDATKRMYEAQCIKDDAMAEAIADYWAVNRHRDVLVVHLCGKFHSDGGLGTVQRLQARQPLAKITVISMERLDPDSSLKPKTMRERAHFILSVPGNPAKE